MAKINTCCCARGGGRVGQDSRAMVSVHFSFIEFVLGGSVAQLLTDFANFSTIFSIAFIIIIMV